MLYFGGLPDRPDNMLFVSDKQAPNAALCFQRVAEGTYGRFVGSRAYFRLTYNRRIQWDFEVADYSN
jgi:hypothetical protein